MSGTGSASGPATSPTATPSRAATSSRRPDTPGRSTLAAVLPQAAHTTGRRAPQRRQAYSSPTRSAGPPQVAQRASSPQALQARRRARPVRLRTTRSRPAGSTRRASATSSSDSQPVRGSAARRSTIVSTGQPPRSADRLAVCTDEAATWVAVGQGDTHRQGAPERAARSAATSAASKRGERSSR